MEELSKFINSRKTNYRTLFPMLRPFKNTKGRSGEMITQSNIFIDVESIFSRLYTNRPVNKQGITYLEYIKSIKGRNKYRMFASELINLAGHLRHFYFSRLMMYTNIYFFYSPDMNRMTSKGIKESFNNRVNDASYGYNEITDLINYTLDLAGEIIKYIPNVYLYRNYDFDKSLVPYYILKRLNTDMTYSFIYTNDKIFDQYTALFPRTYVMTHNSDRSKLYKRDQLYEKRFKSDTSISAMNISSVYAMAGLGPNYNVPTIKGLGPKSAIKIIEEGFPVSATTMDSIIAYTQSKEKLLMNDKRLIENKERHLMNYQAIDVLEQLRHEDNDKNSLFLESQEINLIDAMGLREVNERVFEIYPIMMDFLFEGEEYP